MAANSVLPGYHPLYPRGAGAASGPIPRGHVMVTRWISEAEARIWMRDGATHVPPEVGRGEHVSVGEFGAAQLSGTGPIRLDFSFPEAGLQQGGRADWKFIIQPVAHVPIYNVVIYVPNSVSQSRITGKK
jgi:hypothetical protein